MTGLRREPETQTTRKQLFAGHFTKNHECRFIAIIAKKKWYRAGFDGTRHGAPATGSIPKGEKRAQEHCFGSNTSKHLSTLGVQSIYTQCATDSRQGRRKRSLERPGPQGRSCLVPTRTSRTESARRAGRESQREDNEGGGRRKRQWRCAESDIDEGGRTETLCVYSTSKTLNCTDKRGKTSLYMDTPKTPTT